MEKILIFGNSQLAEVVSYYINNDSKYEICGYVVDDEFIKNTDSFLKKPPYDYQKQAVKFFEINNRNC